MAQVVRPGLGVGEERWPGDEQRAQAAQPLDVERGREAGRLAEGNQVAERRQAVQAFVEGVFAHRIVDCLHPLAPGDPLDLGQEILLRVQDDFVCARLTRQLCLFFGGGRADHPRALLFGDLGQQQTDAPGRGVHQAPIAGFERIGAGGEHVRGHALNHRRDALLKTDRRREEDQAVAGDQAVGGVCAQPAEERHPVAGLRLSDARPDGLHHARALAAGDSGQGDLVPSQPLIDLDEIDADRRQLDQRLAGAGGRRRAFLKLQYLRAAEFRIDNRVHFFFTSTGAWPCAPTN